MTEQELQAIAAELTIEMMAPIRDEFDRVLKLIEQQHTFMAGLNARLEILELERLHQRDLPN